MAIKTPVVIGLSVLAIGIVYAISRKAVCLNIEPNLIYNFTYTGPSQTVRKALGDCYPVIYTIDIWDEETTDWITVVDPQRDILETGVLCRVEVVAPCELCNFEA